MPLILIASVLSVGLMAAVILIAREIASAKTGLPLNADWIEDLSVERYRPMMRLLDDGDLEFLRAEAGASSRSLARLRAQRSRIFLEYLGYLRGDFRRVCTAIKFLMLQSSVDRPDLAALLIRSQATFALVSALMGMRVLLFRWGICGADASVLVRTFDAMRLELRTLSPAFSGAAA